MEFNFSATSHREIINDYLGYRKKRRPRGVIRKLSDSLRCHPTFIAQVLNEHADFSPEQAYEICRHFSFSNDQQNFLTLHLRDRAGTAGLKEYYQQKINRLLELKRDLRPKKQAKEIRSGAFESEYFGNWIYQAVHALTQIPRLQSASTLAKTLAISVEEVKSILIRLETMGLVKNEKSVWKSTLDSLHLSKDSPLFVTCTPPGKQNCLRICNEIQKIEGTRYSGLITVTEKIIRKCEISWLKPSETFETL
ncbi:MAG: DUF4423 domain-containing protein [Bdellovibrionales bacterium]|nr:DUF4423 domain-containing protein [Bdellovibrionales bacterium]